MEQVTPARPATERSSGPWLRKLLTYGGGSLIATGCSELALLATYGLLHASPTVASLVGWIAGAVPNYWLNRTWTWRRRGRPSLRRELLPYATVIGLTLLLAVLATKAADAALRSAGASPSTRVALVAVTFLGVYVVMFGVRFLLLDRLFGMLAARDTEPTEVHVDHDA